ncbi:MAG: 2-hydroxyacid dehydrogenase [Solirubrobacteraceae bacterium]
MPPSAHVLVTSSASPDIRRAIADALAGTATVSYLVDLPAAERAGALDRANAVLSWNLAGELKGSEELARLGSTGLIQLCSAGVDHVPWPQIPTGTPVASNLGGYAEPMAEHVLAMALALAKRLPQNHAGLARGEFDQETLNRAIHGSVVGILGFGGIGHACADLFQALGARIHAINRSGRTDREVEFIGAPADLDPVLAVADILVISIPMTRQTRGMIGARELALMRADAILVNVARGAIVVEDALYRHLCRHPKFSAGIDVWWGEPFEPHSFSTRHPFLELPNVIGSPHNSPLTPGALVEGARRAAMNVARHLRGEPVTGLVDRSDYTPSADSP